MKLTKKRKKIVDTYERNKKYGLLEALSLVKKIDYAKFDSGVDATFNLGVDPKRSDQIVRGTVSLPHGLGKEIKILAICGGADVDASLEAGAKYAGTDEYITKIKEGWADFDVCICHPSYMGKIGQVGKILGPKGLMPNPKSGTVTPDVITAVKEFKAGKNEFRTDKYGIVHVSIGKTSFTEDKLNDNMIEVYKKILSLKPAKAKGTYIKGVTLSSTMGPSIKVDSNTLK